MPPPLVRDHSDEPLTLLEAFSLFRDFSTRFAYRIEHAADLIISATDEREVKREAVLWKIRSITKCREALYRDAPQLTAVDQWTLCVQLRQYLTQGDGQKLFGQWQSIAVAAVTASEEDFLKLVSIYIPQHQFDQARRELEAWCERHPIRGVHDARLSAATPSRTQR